VRAGQLHELVAAVVLAHAEENRSTPIRIATTFVFLVGCGFAAFANSIETATILLVVTVLCITPSLFFVTTEKERLPRAVAARVGGPTRFLLPLAAWLPGGGRGALYAGFHLSAALFAQLSIGWFVFGEPARFDGQFMRLFATVMVLCVFLLLPSGMLSPYANKPHAVAFSRFLIVIGAVAVLLVPVIVRVLTGFDELMHWSLVERPFDIDPSGKPRAFGPWLLLVGLAVLALTVNIPRVVASFGELRECAERSRAKVSSGAATDA
jgi:fumarate reductase subunit D